ncbi:hypothetical protein AVEN_2273-1 [Araneus ventricosus]|uniref:Uncharacterized protein n=1 Tax=Araneus ventricosus TaxID=182803 RepID=A0A4Y2FRG8_ARAVE|nr:hypothetical protein AVEN_2273-1 [Araneus ventricosus]
MAGVTKAQASVMRRRRSCNVGGGIANTCPLMCARKKKSNEVKSVLGRSGPVIASLDRDQFYNMFSVKAKLVGIEAFFSYYTLEV